MLLRHLAFFPFYPLPPSDPIGEIAHGNLASRSCPCFIPAGAPGGKSVGPRAGKRGSQSQPHPHTEPFSMPIQVAVPNFRTTQVKFRPRERSIFERSTAPQVVGSHILGQWMLGILFALLPSMRTQTEREVLGVWRLGELALLIRQTEQVASFSPNSLLSRSSPRFGRNIQRLHLFDQRWPHPVSFFAIPLDTFLSQKRLLDTF